VQSDESAIYVLGSVKLSFSYIDLPDITGDCAIEIEQNALTAMVFVSPSDQIRDDTHALLQSDSLWNEQIPVHHFSEQCGIKGSYFLDFRVSDLLLSALLAEEEIRITTHHEKGGPLTGLVPTKGFDTAYPRLMNCIEAMQD
jgi:hypothetical protein